MAVDGTHYRTKRRFLQACKDFALWAACAFTEKPYKRYKQYLFSFVALAE
jgi:hypothetical protein